MTTPELPEIVYESSRQEVVVEPLSPEAIDEDAARAALTLHRDAYAAQLEGMQLPRGSVTQAYDPSSRQQVANRRAMMLDYAKNAGSQYWVVRNSRAPDTAFDGLIKLSPLSEGHGSQQPTYLNDILVREWRQGIGTKLVHSALVAGGWALNRTVLLDAYEGSSVNEWYKRLNFHPTGSLGHVAVAGRQVLTRTYVHRGPASELVAQLTPKVGTWRKRPARRQ